MRRSKIFLIGTTIGLAACGTLPEERGISGAGIGAGAGAVIGAVASGLSVMQGIVVGAVAGGLAGALTDSSQINFGEPLWKKGSSTRNAAHRTPTGAYAATRSTKMVSHIQADLGRLGYAPGSVDGIAGRKTRAAIREYQKDNRLAKDGKPTAELAAHLSRQIETGSAATPKIVFKRSMGLSEGAME